MHTLPVSFIFVFGLIRNRIVKVLILSTSDTQGGAAVAALRLADALDNIGVEVRVLVCKKRGVDAKVYELCRGKLNRYKHKWAFLAERAMIYKANGRDRSKLFHVSTSAFGLDISHHPLVAWADILHLHWINQGFLSLQGLERVATLGKAIVWTMHDLWPATAICHHPRHCTHFREEQPCGCCEQINSKQVRDLSRCVAERKKALYARLQPVLLGCSHWIAEQAAASTILSGRPILSIPNPINTDLFSPMDRAEARAALGLTFDCPSPYLILFGAVKADDYRKGIGEMSRTLQLLYSDRPELRGRLKLITFGHLAPEAASMFPDFETVRMGYISSTETMKLLYNAVDLFVTPSLEENLPNTIMEAQACGTPSLGFATGGIPEMISNELLGHVSPYRSADDMADYIYRHWQASYDQDGQETPFGGSQREACRRSAVQRYDRTVVAKLHLALYEKLLRGDLLSPAAPL